MNDWIIIAVVALLPMGAFLTVLQRNPYHALVARGIFGAIAALVYATLGAPDVALTEILMGTLLTIVLYAIAVRSSLVLRLGWISPEQHENSSTADYPFPIEVIRSCSQSHYLRLELVAFDNREKLLDALCEGKIAAACGEGPLPGMPFSENADKWLLFDAADSLEATFAAGFKNLPMTVHKLSELKQR